MSSASLQTGSGSSSTLLRGMELAAQPVGQVLAVKLESGLDEEEMEMRKQLQASGSKKTICKGVSVNRDQ